MSEPGRRGMPSAPHPESIRLVALLCLTLIVVSAIAGLTVVAVSTSRELWPAEVLTFIGSVLVAVLGGLHLRRVAGWRVNGEDRNPPPDPDYRERYARRY